MREYIESLQIPKSTLDEFEYLLQAPTKGKETVHDPFRALFRAIHDDTLSLVGVIQVSLRRIRAGTLQENLMQDRVTFWRNLLHQLNFSLTEFDQQLREFVHFAYDSEAHPLSLDPRTELPSEKLAKDIRQTLRGCMELIDKSFDSLRAEMQILDSRRSIAEAESVSKLTELAFVFIPLSCVASIFSMQVHELDGGVPLYQAVVVAMAFIVVAYAIRLSIRSSSLIEFKDRTLHDIRETAELQYNDPIPTRTFLAYVARVAVRAVSEMIKHLISVWAPLILVLAVIAAIVSPIVLLWLRRINTGFTAVMTVLLLLLDLVLIYPVLTNSSGEWGLDPAVIVREIQRNRRISREKRKEGKKKRKMKRRADADISGLDSGGSSDEAESGSV
jgi:hypothetical protein